MGESIDLPISDQTVRDSLKYYARKAGLRTRGLKVHSLRHTAAYLRAQAGDDEDTIRRFFKAEQRRNYQIVFAKAHAKS
jgi:site-specific recombinase XerD